MTTETTVVRPRVLCVDDDTSVLAALRRQLRGRYDVVLASGAAEGLARLRDEGPFAVVVSDLHMPEGDGHAFLAAAHAVAPGAIAILMTGSDEHEAPLRADLDGLVFHRLAKPCRPDELWAAIEAALAHRTRGTESA